MDKKLVQGRGCFIGVETSTVKNHPVVVSSTICIKTFLTHTVLTTYDREQQAKNKVKGQSREIFNVKLDKYPSKYWNILPLSLNKPQATRVSCQEACMKDGSGGRRYVCEEEWL